MPSADMSRGDRLGAMVCGSWAADSPLPYRLVVHKQALCILLTCMGWGARGSAQALWVAGCWLLATCCWLLAAAGLCMLGSLNPAPCMWPSAVPCHLLVRPCWAGLLGLLATHMLACCCKSKHLSSCSHALSVSKFPSAACPTAASLSIRQPAHPMLYDHCCSASQASPSAVLHRPAAAPCRAMPRSTSASLRAHADPDSEVLDVRVLQRRLQGHANLYNCHMLLLSVPCRQAADDCLICLLQGHANRYKRHIVPMLSLSVDFYVRVFVRVYTSPAAVKDSATKLMHVYQSLGCDSFFMQRVGRKVGCCQGMRAHLLCNAPRLSPEPWLRSLGPAAGQLEDSFCKPLSEGLAPPQCPPMILSEPGSPFVPLTMLRAGLHLSEGCISTVSRGCVDVH